MQANLAGQPEATSPAPSPGGRGMGRWVATASSGLALGTGLAATWLGPRLRAGARGQHSPEAGPGLFRAAVCCGGAWLLPRAVSQPEDFRLDIDVLMGLAILGAIGLGQWDEAATVAFLFGLSESLESLSLERARRAIRRLLEITPQTAERIRPDGTIERVPAGQVGAATTFWCVLATRSRSMAMWIKGRSSVDQKTITGESVPVERGPGDLVYAGTVNGEGTFEIEAGGPASDSLIARIVAQVRGPGRPGGRRAADRPVRGRLHAGRGDSLAPGHDRPTALDLGHRGAPGRCLPGRSGTPGSTRAWSSW